MVQPQKRLTGNIGPSIARTCPPDCLTSFRVPSVWLHCAHSEHTDLQLEHHDEGLLGGLQDASQLDKVCQGQLVRVYELRQRRGREGSSRVSFNATPCAFGVTLFDCGIHTCSHICNMGFT